ncbi:MAG: hypothetical protein JWR34_1800 [Mycobacterium sp.]|nr:hypothetical protein [Mycobacterium sp.]
MTDTLVPITAEVVSLDKPDAERLDERIRLLVGSINDNLTDLYDLVEQAKQGHLHTALGYPSWTAYVADVFTMGVRLDREQRRELSVFLSGEGMSQRKIGAVVGVDQKTVCNDLHAGEENSSPTKKLSRAEAEAVTARIRSWVDAKPAELDDDTAKQLLEDTLAEQGYEVTEDAAAKPTPDAQTAPVDLDSFPQKGRGNEKRQLRTLETLRSTFWASAEALELRFEGGFEKTCTPEIVREYLSSYNKDLARINRVKALLTRYARSAPSGSQNGSQGQ